ncbi:MAG: WecB/TagA/CpsF family glycosyltransferase [Cyanobacteria bacterium P01_A01_bin.105]
MNPVRQASILGTPISGTSYGDACDRIQVWATARRSCYVVAANVHVVMTAYWQPTYRTVLQGAVLVTPDGMPLVWGLRWLGLQRQSRVYGPDLMLAWCDRAAELGLPIFLYGSTPETLAALESNLRQRFPTLPIAGAKAPPFRALTVAEMQTDAQVIADSGAAVVFVGLGCPKQERWMAQQQGQIPAVMVGVGAAFSFHGGAVIQAPRWMMKAGLEWLFRLWQEPGRLWKRYLVNNGAFVVLFGSQLLRQTIGGWVRSTD